MAKLKQSVEEWVNDHLLLKRSMQTIFEGPDGQRVLEYLCRQAGITKFRPCETEEERIRMEERRRFVFSIIRYVEIPESELFQRLKENVTHDET